MQLCENETKSGFLATKRSIKTKKKKKIICARCQKAGHKSPNCRAPTPVSKGNLAQTESDSDESSVFTAVYYGNLSHEEETVSSSTHVANISQSADTEIYWIDSGASEHVSNNRNHFTDFRPTNGYISGIASGVQVIGKGTVVLSKGHKTVTLKDVLYAPQCPSNLIAINKAVLAGKKIEISNKELWCGKDLLGTYHHQNKLFKSTYKVMSSSSSYSKAYKASVSDLHIVMGHPSKPISARLQIPNPPHLCQDCLAGRFVKSKPKISSTSVSRPLELLHADIYTVVIS
ncbi:hypothetical protein KL921_005410 [Ogataea angusta]|nr:hypothetical protein KL921_005410 [Ogataea angusta]